MLFQKHGEGLENIDTLTFGLKLYCKLFSLIIQFKQVQKQ